MTEEEEQLKEHKKRKRRRRAYGTGSLFYREDRKLHVAQIVLENGKTIQRYFKTQKEAADALDEMLYELRRGSLITEKDQTVRQYLEHWLENVHKRSIRISTYSEYRSILNAHILPELGHIKLRQLTIQRVEAFYMKKSDGGLSASRVRLIHAILHRALAHAVKHNLVVRNVCDHVTLPRRIQHERHTLTVEQARELLARAKGHRLEALLTVALVTGMREGELLALRWSDVNFGQQYLQVRRTVRRITGQGFKENEPKTASSRRKIVLPPFLLEVLRQHRMRQAEVRQAAGLRWEEHDLVFCNGYGKFISPPKLRENFAKLLRDSGLPRMRFHDLRHSSATLLLAMGIHAKVVQELLGHSNIAITLGVYSHVLPSMQQDAVEKMSNLFTQQDNRSEGNKSEDDQKKREDNTQEE